MKLSELRPKWTGIEHPDKYGESIAIGVSFDCPHCRKQRLAVFFKPFIDCDNVIHKKLWALPDAPDPNTGKIKEVTWWKRVEGVNFDTLTLNPSINASNSSHWHGSIINGEMVL